MSPGRHVRVRVRGTVQGVGFRPFVYRHAVALGLDGWVRNDGEGVVIDLTGEAGAVEALVQVLAGDPPPLARVQTVELLDLAPNGAAAPAGFRIVESASTGAAAAPVSVDTATCAGCLAEVFDPADRRYMYPFTNCTDCGPRYTIVLRVPYDRPFTTMRGFAMCAACRAEYDDPADRRFHAQPNACPACGPVLSLCRPDGSVQARGDAALDGAVDALRSGRVVAVKGVGGYHLACDATDDAAVALLRRRKARDAKPFAVMASGVAGARQLCRLDPGAVDALTSPRRPIVLAPRRDDAAVAEDVAPGLADLGLMLAYTPLHHLLLAGVGRPLVMTSGNLSDEPIAHEDRDALARLGDLADMFLTHDRPIHIRCDDSVVRSTGRRVQAVRRSRGYAPEPMRLPVSAGRQILAVGAELKSTVAVARDDQVVVSHHIGDLEHLAGYRAFLQAVEHLPALYGISPGVVVHDMHPEYLSTKWATETGLPTIAVQHHHAHIAACLAEHGRTGPVVGLAFDGLGLGTDGTLWGGEILVADLYRSERVGHLAAVPMPGGAAAIREPWRMAVAWLAQAAGSDAAVAAAKRMGEGERARAVLQVAASDDVLVTTSAGRLFDAVAALAGLRSRVSFEGQAAMEMEARAGDFRGPGYTVEVDADVVLHPESMIRAIDDDVAHGVGVSVVSARFHAGLGASTARAAIAAARRFGLGAVALSGGVFQNALLTRIVEDRLRAAGLDVLVHARIPPNDGGISVGQAAIAAAMTGAERPSC